jgi:hypothetical protein
VKLHIIRIESVIPAGIGGPEAGALDLIYSFLLQEYKCDYYGHIQINQIGDDLDELIIKDGKHIHINIRYPANDFEKKSLKERNLFRLEVVHTALMRIAEEDKKLDFTSLQKIRDRIIHQDFVFDFVYKQYVDHRFDVTGKIIIHPMNDKFCFYFLAEQNSIILCNILLYEGLCTEYYIPEIFHSGKWKTANEFVIKDKKKELELHVFVDQEGVKLINLTRYKSPPFYEMMKAGAPNIDARKDWLHSLPPGTAGAISFEPN